MENQQELIERVAGWVHRRGLSLPTVMLLELHKPLAGVGSALVHFLAPGLEWMLGEQDTETLAKLLSDRKQVERLIARIEELDSIPSKEVNHQC